MNLVSLAAFEQPVHDILPKARGMVISGLRPVFVPDPPFAIMGSRTPSQTLGLGYEKKVGKQLQKYADQLGWKLFSHMWIRYEEQYAQPDFFLVSPSGACILFEIKLTWTDCSDQINLYKDLLTQMGFGPITTCTVCKNLTPRVSRKSIVRDFYTISDSSTWQLRL